METKTDLNSNEDVSICSHHRLILQVLEPITAVNSVGNNYQCEECHQTCMVTFTGQFTESSSDTTDEWSQSSASESSESDDDSFERSSNKDSHLIDLNATKSDESGSNSSVISNQTVSSNWLLREFDYLNVILGEGNFGCVGKFRNNKDDQVYAIKKTSWTERNMREVKVLSTLQHDNIVRYYNSWTEPNDLSWPAVEIKDKEEESSEQVTEDDDCDQQGSTVLYIKMQFCEKETLRKAIDSGDLARNRFRMWNLFRQIVEAISYFHSKGVVHRDLNPKNVFLYSENCVKIGDFGFATTDAIKNSIEPTRPENETISTSTVLNKSLLDKQCGTTSYMAPELKEMINGKDYGTEVDMYSLGIIFFEMCSEPFTSGMERAVKLEDLRKPDIIISPNSYMPSYLQETIWINYFGPNGPALLTNNMVDIIKKLLDHDPSKRLSAKELLKSPIMHPPLFDKQPEFFQFLDFLLQPQSVFTTYSEYYQLMGRCLQQSTSEGKILQWLNGNKDSCDSLSRNDSLTLHGYPSVLKIFFKRCEETGAQYFQPATVFPKMSIKEDYRSVGLKELATVLENDSSRSFVDKHGTLAVLPVDSHTSFARHVASYNIKELKRYCVNQVYNNYNVGPPPEPSAELAFDVVTSSSSSLRQADVEVIQVIDKILQDLPLPSYVLQLNHHLLVKAVLSYSKVPENQHSKACSLLKVKTRNIRNGMDGFITTVNEELNTLFTPESLELVLKLLKMWGNLSEIKSYILSLPEWTDAIEAASLAKVAFEELEEIINHQKSCSVCPIFINLSIGLEKYKTHSGFLFNFTHQSSEYDFTFFAGYSTENALAEGGRYDSLVQSFRKVLINQPYYNMNKDQSDNQLHVAGGVIYVNNLVPATEKESFLHYNQLDGIIILGSI